MTRSEYVERVLSVMRHVTPSEREAIRAEIDAHIEDHICDLLELDYDEALAEERTMALMGDPEEVGRELDKQYTNSFWLWHCQQGVEQTFDFLLHLRFRNTKCTAVYQAKLDCHPAQLEKILFCAVGH